MRVQAIEPGQHAALADLTVAAYRALPGRPPSPQYTALLRDVDARARDAEVLVALDDDGVVLGGVTYVGDRGSGYAEFDGADEAGFRMLAVAPAAQGLGAGAALVAACIELARRDGKRRLTLLTTDGMAAAHRLYARFGFRREPASDMMVASGLQLRSFVLDLEED
jgi:GNAT superfamily N-acetyltransferase